MATYDNDSRVQPGTSRDSRGASRTGYSAGRTAPTQRTPQRSTSGTRTSAGQRPASGQRTASGQRRPTSQRPASGQRSSSQRASSGRRPAPRRKQPNRAPLFAALAAVVVLVLVLVIAKPFGGPKADPGSNPPAVPASNPVEPVAAQPDLGDVEAEPQVEYDNLEDKLADGQYDVGSLSAADMAQVTDLKVNTSLPGEWLNVLLLGTDERVLNDSARTDAMMICSINRSTGEVKLSSIMRDLAIEYTDIGKYNGTYRINAANYFGGPNLAMRTVNEKFNMNIQSYVMVNFYGFQRIAEKLGGIDIDITEDEMNQINHWVYNVWSSAHNHNIDISDVEWVKLETYGENVHLNGTQSLAYARIRKLEGGDYMRAQRQRTVLTKLLEKAKKLDAIQLAALATEMLKDVKTNLPLDDIFPVAVLVCGNGLSGLKTMQLPDPQQPVHAVRLRFLRQRHPAVQFHLRKLIAYRNDLAGRRGGIAAPPRAYA